MWRYSDKLCRHSALLGGFAFLPTFFSTILSNTIIGINIDDSGSLVVNFNLLSTFPATLVGGVYHDFVNQVIQ